ncbi:MAG: rhomboid family intramembrane serine protease [Desulfonauticus sp.]|nr:rhomboid family intramembrane serine protease [Desulfonauticus sp.]
MVLSKKNIFPSQSVWVKLPEDKLDVAQINQIILVLEALFIPWIEINGNIFVLIQDYERSLKEISEYQKEEREKQVKCSLTSCPCQTNKRTIFYANLGFMTFLLLVFVLQQYFPNLTSWGLLDGKKIFQGQIYRLFTALFLHHDPAHVLGNVVFSFYFIWQLGTSLGCFKTWLLILVLATLANGINLLCLGQTHRSLGFSTASFVGLGMYIFYQGPQKKTSAYLSAALGLGFLAMFSGGKHTDLGAHFWGFTLGSITGWIIRKTQNISLG